MTIAVSILFLLATIATVLILQKRRRDREQIARYSISVEELHTNLAGEPQPLIFDVRLPLDILADPNIIPDARRVPPKELVDNPALIPRDQDVVVYCTCPGDETSRLVIRKAHEMQFTRVKFLRGGLAAWKAGGYPVTAYTEAFHLDTGTGPSLRR